MSTKATASASTPMSNASGQSDDCQETTQDDTPNAASSGPNRLAGPPQHQYRPTSNDAATRYP